MLSNVLQLPSELLGEHVFSMLKLADLGRLDSAVAQRRRRNGFETALKLTSVELNDEHPVAFHRWCTLRNVVITELNISNAGIVALGVDLLSDIVRLLRNDTVVSWKCCVDSPSADAYNAIEASGLVTKITSAWFLGPQPGSRLQELVPKMVGLQDVSVSNSNFAPWLLSCPPLKVLTFMIQSRNELDVRQLLSRHVATLHTLRLVRTVVDRELLTTVCELANLRTFELQPHQSTNEYLDASAAQALLTAIATGCAKLECIMVSLVYVDWPAHLLSALLCSLASHCARLREITLLPTVALSGAALVRVAENCPALHKLSRASWEVLSMDSVTAAQSLWARLTVLSVDNSGVPLTPAATATLAFAVSRLHCIEELTVSVVCSDPFPPQEGSQEHGSFLDQAFTGMATQSGARLRKLSFCRGLIPDLTDATIDALAEHCPNLEWVDLTACTAVTEAAVMCLVDSCDHLEGIVTPSTFSREARQRVWSRRR